MMGPQKGRKGRVQTQLRCRRIARSYRTKGTIQLAFLPLLGFFWALAVLKSHGLFYNSMPYTFAGIRVNFRKARRVEESMRNGVRAVRLPSHFPLRWALCFAAGHSSSEGLLGRWATA